MTTMHEPWDDPPQPTPRPTSPPPPPPGREPQRGGPESANDVDDFAAPGPPSRDDPSPPSWYREPHGGDSAPPPPRRGRAIAAWTAIILSVLVICAYRYVPALQPSPPPGATTVDPVKLLFVDMISRYIIGLEQFRQMVEGNQPGPAPQGLSRDDIAQLIRMDEKGDDVDELRLAIMEAELYDKQSAIDRLDDLASRPGMRGEEMPEALDTDIQALRLVYNDNEAALTDAMRESLVKRHGFLGELALTQGGDDSPKREALLTRAKRTLIAVAGLAMAGLMVGLLSVVLLIIAIVFLARGKVKWRWRLDSPRVQGVSMLGAAGFFVLFAGLIIGAHIAYERGVVLPSALTAGAAVGLLLPFVLGRSWRQFRAEAGLLRGAGLVKEFFFGIVGYLAAVPIVFVILMVSVLVYTAIHELFGLGDPEPATHPVIFEDMTNLWTVVGIYALAAIWAPLVEETVFRGAMLSHARPYLGRAGAILLTSFLFAIIHPQGLVAVPGLMALAAVFALLREWRGTIIGPIAAHFVHNAAIVTVMVVMFTI